MTIRVSERSLFVILLLALLMLFSYPRRKPELVAAPKLPSFPPTPKHAKQPTAVPTRAANNHPLPNGAEVIKGEAKRPHVFPWTNEPKVSAQDHIAATRKAGLDTMQEALNREPAAI